jgi:hypothetical protein
MSANHGRSDANIIGSPALSVSGISDAAVLADSACRNKLTREPPIPAGARADGAVMSANRGRTEASTIGSPASRVSGISGAEVIADSACRNRAACEPLISAGARADGAVMSANRGRTEANAMGSLAPWVSGISEAAVIAGSACRHKAARGLPASATGKSATSLPFPRTAVSWISSEAERVGGATTDARGK